MQIDNDPKFPVGTAVRIVASKIFCGSVGAVGIVTDFNHGEYLKTIPPNTLIYRVSDTEAWYFDDELEALTPDEIEEYAPDKNVLR